PWHSPARSQTYCPHSRLEMHKWTGHHRLPQTYGHRHLPTRPASGTAAYWCPGTHQPEYAGSGVDNVRVWARYAAAARKHATAVRQKRRRLRVHTDPDTADKFRPDGAGAYPRLPHQKASGPLP